MPFDKDALQWLMCNHIISNLVCMLTEGCEEVGLGYEPISLFVRVCDACDAVPKTKIRSTSSSKRLWLPSADGCEKFI